LKAVLLPSGWIAIFAFAGLLLLVLRKRRKATIVSLALAAATYIVFSTGPVAYVLLSGLEHGYLHSSAAEAQTIDTAVILAGYAETHPWYPLSSQVNAASAHRLLEALTLRQRNPRLQIIISGESEVVEVLARMLEAAGVPAEGIEVDASATNTRTSAVNLAPRLAGKRFWLVTSAGHMPRALGVFHKQGMVPIPAATHYLARKTLLQSLLPTPQHLEYSDLAVHEYLALLWYRIQGYV
jgi:uncharacterized SAM-binding protein YcdF (DUF218 family)